MTLTTTMAVAIERKDIGTLRMETLRNPQSWARE
jgi:hypothetical protein